MGIGPPRSACVANRPMSQMITEDTFALTYPWHLEEWYARRNRRRQLQAAREYVNLMCHMPLQA